MTASTEAQIRILRAWSSITINPEETLNAPLGGTAEVQVSEGYCPFIKGAGIGLYRKNTRKRKV